MPAAVTTCLYCQKPIKSGRSDKKFCDSGCKDAYYNEKKGNERSEIGKIDVVLKKNRRILKASFNPKKPDVLVLREKLIKSGFEFDYHTHFVITKTKKNQFIFCYDYGYREVEKDRYQIIKSFK